jgi:hypothetical protein
LRYYLLAMQVKQLSRVGENQIRAPKKRQRVSGDEAPIIVLIHQSAGGPAHLLGMKI